MYSMWWKPMAPGLNVKFQRYRKLPEVGWQVNCISVFQVCLYFGNHKTCTLRACFEFWKVKHINPHSLNTCHCIMQNMKVDHSNLFCFCSINKLIDDTKLYIVTYWNLLSSHRLETTLKAPCEIPYLWILHRVFSPSICFHTPLS